MKHFGNVTWGDGEYEISDVRRSSRSEVLRRVKGAKFFKIECEPYVMIRLKRMFEGIAKGSHKKCELMDTPQNAHELLWFMQEFPLDMDEGVRERLAERDGLCLKRRQMMEDFTKPDYVPVKVDLALPLRDYQHVAVDLAIKSGGILVGDDVGVGKSPVGIGCFADEARRPALVVCMNHLMDQWEDEIHKFMPGLKVKQIKKGRGVLTDLMKWRGRPCPLPDVVICSYHQIAGWAIALSGWAVTVIYDEIQEGRRNDSEKYTGLCTVSEAAKLRVGLSASPIYNYGGEIWNVMNVVSPGSLGSAEEFGREWCGGFWGDKAAIEDPKAFGKYMREAGLMIRRTRKDVGREIPAVQTLVHKVDADLWRLEQIEHDLAELATKLLEQSGVTAFDKMTAARDFDMKLRQQTGIAKAPYVADYVKLLCEAGEKVVVFAWHREVYSILMRQLRDYGPVMYTGSESKSQKSESVEAFTKGKAGVFLMSLRAGAGLNGLQDVCSVGVTAELDWSPRVHEQNIGRLARDLTTGEPCGPVMNFILVSEAGSDPVIADVLGIKNRQSDGVMNPDKDLFEEPQADPERVKAMARAFLEKYRSKGDAA